MPELRLLVMLPGWHAAVKNKRLKPHLVTTGTLNNTAHHRLRQFNEGLKQDGYPAIELIDNHVLSKWFRDAFGAFLPLELANSRRLLECYLSDGREPLDKLRFHALLTDFPAFMAREKGKMRRYVSGLPILAAYAMASATGEQNHLAETEAWVLTAAQIRKVAESHSLNESHWHSSYVLCRDAAVARLSTLFDEAITDNKLIAGTIFGDGGLIWRSRVTILMGCLAAFRLVDSLLGNSDDCRDQRAVRFILDHRKYLFVWGESAASCVWMIYWFMRGRPGFSSWAENLLLQYIMAACHANSAKDGMGLAPPHEGVDACLRRLYSAEKANRFPFSTFRGITYTVRPMIFELARTLRRQGLAAVWPVVSDVAHAQMLHHSREDRLDFHVAEGTQHAAYFDRPTRWGELRDQARREVAEAPATLPTSLADDPAFGVLFALVHPHRLDSHFTAALGSMIRPE